ncbi:DEAD/DEAH box helicase [Breznakia pachnodae]|uniref:SNF2 family DNA or RNA helicase n=1 Tax=Breznakia pachnodae TaxID=265178 RepID=A0ABU0E5F9_9FIRM|nr:SNF2-related protein [Breznakia pachnodae]MDQ0362127.1 SNF2 family DNA or RNA helicase [Breznakia pachnodae]
MRITDKEIRRVVSNPQNYSWGLSNYFNYSNFEYYQVNRLSNHYIIDCFITNYRYENSVSITLDSNFNVVEHYCDCRFHTHDSACGHVAAALLLFQEKEITSFPYDLDKDDDPRIAQNDWRIRLQKQQEEYERLRKQRLMKTRLKKGNNLLDYFRSANIQSVQQLTTSDKYRLEFTFSYMDGYGDFQFMLEAKIGNDRLYVIKDFRNLLEDIENENVHFYGTKLEFIHTKNSFDNFTQSTLPFIKRVVNSMHQEYATSYRTLSIMKDDLDEFYELFNTSGRRYINIDFRQQLMRIKLSVSQEEKGYLIQLVLDDDFFEGNNYYYHFHDNTLIRLDMPNKGQFYQLYKELLDDDLFIANENYQEFIMYITSQFGDSIEFIGDKPEVSEYEKTLELYGDIEDGNLVFKLNAIWKDETVENVFDPNFKKELSLNGRKIEYILKDYGEVMDNEPYSLLLSLNEDRTFQFVSDVLPELNEYCNVFVSESLKNLNANRSISISVGVRLESDLLKIDFDSVNCSAEEISDVLKAYKKKKKFHQLKNGEVISLESKELDELDQLMEDLNLNPKDIHGAEAELPMYNAFSLTDKIDHFQNLSGREDDTFKQLLDSFSKANIEELQIKPKYEDILKEYQKYGVKWLMTLSQYGFGGILADDMGLGKTLQVIAYLESTFQEGKTSIVVCPASLMLNWQDELEKFSSDLKSICIYGNVEERKIQIQRCQNYDIVITTYDYIKRDVELYNDIQFDSVILDEAQYIKNHTTKAAKATKSLHSRIRFALTGTPIENSLAELWSIFDFLMPNYLYNYSYFKRRYETPIIKMSDKKKEYALKQMTEPFLLRRRKQEVLHDLPDKIEKTLSFHFNREEEQLYLAHLSQANKELQEYLNMQEENKVAMLKILLRLRQICCEPRVLYDNIKTASSKMKGCLEVIESLKESNKKVLLFSSFTSILDLLAEELRKKDISYLMLTGDVAKDQRKILTAKFQEGNTDVFLISLKAGGVGLNLTKAEAVIHYDPWWNLSAQNQATDRAHRIGQENEVQVFNLIMKNSIEEKILQLQQMKKSISDTFVENSKGSIATMSTNDILELLKRD